MKSKEESEELLKDLQEDYDKSKLDEEAIEMNDEAI